MFMSLDGRRMQSHRLGITTSCNILLPDKYDADASSFSLLELISEPYRPKRIAIFNFKRNEEQKDHAET